MKRLGVFLLPLDGMLVHRRVTPSIKFAGIHLYTWVERGTVRAKCLAQEHNTMSPARARTLRARSRVERTNYEATAPPQSGWWMEEKLKKADVFLFIRAGRHVLGIAIEHKISIWIFWEYHHFGNAMFCATVVNENWEAKNWSASRSSVTARSGPLSLFVPPFFEKECFHLLFAALF